jgi:6-phosphogluconolactonase
MNNILHFKKSDELARKASLFIVSCIEEALEKHGDCSIILAGGNTPRACYGRLALLIKDRNIPQNLLYWFFSDERWVPRESPQSNEGMAHTLLFTPLGIRPEQVFSWHAGQDSPFTCALLYQQLINDFFITKTRLPDICVLGMGADGHTASLFPHSRVLTQPDKSTGIKKDLRRNAIAVILPDNKTYRLTLTPHFINKSKNIIFLIEGRAKAQAFAQVQKADQTIPAAWINGKNLVFFINDEVLGASGSY